MPPNLIRYQHRGDFHFITFSCYHRLPYLGTPSARNLFERSLEKVRLRYHFVVAGYVVMPEHVHLLVSEPRVSDLATALQALKLSVSVQSSQRPFWQKRYYDFNVFTPRKTSEKIHYIHENPVRRGLVTPPRTGLGPPATTTRPPSPARSKSDPRPPPPPAPLNYPQLWVPHVSLLRHGFRTPLVVPQTRRRSVTP